MNTSSEEKKMLIESMKKLVSHVSNNPQRQRQIFDALSLNDLNKIVSNLRDQNEYLRRISALLLCELFYQNKHTKQGAMKLLEIQPAYGRICLGGIPESIHKYPSTLKKCLELMQAPVSEEEEEKMCWLVNLERKSLKIETMDYKKYSSFTFIDPMKHLFGFTFSVPTRPFSSPRQPTNPQQSPTAVVKAELDSSRHKKTLYNGKKAEPQRIRVPLQSPKQAYKPATDFYKNFMEGQNRPKQGKRYSYGTTLNSSLENRDESTRARPITSRYGVALGTKKDSLQNSMEVRTGTGSGAQTSRSSYGQYRQRKNQSGLVGGHNSSLQYSGKGYDPGESYFLSREAEGTKRQTRNDRKMSGTVKQRLSMGTGTQAVGQQSMRVSFGGTSGRQVSSDHQKFYRRVKEILRK